MDKLLQIVKQLNNAPVEREDEQDAATRYILAVLARYDDSHEFLD